MTTLIPFKFDNFNVRVIPTDDGFTVVAKDVAEALGYVWNGTARIAHVPAEWRGVTSVVTPSGIQEMATLTEQGLYFFLNRSDKPAALPMQKWVAGEVLPSIRKTGSYSAAKPASLSVLEILQLATDAEKGRLAAVAEVAALTHVVTAQTPKVEALDRIAASGGDLCITDAAKELQIPRHRLYQLLTANRWLYQRLPSKTWIAYDEKRHQGLLKHIEVPYVHTNGDPGSSMQVRITRKGLVKLSLLLTASANDAQQRITA